MAAKGAEIEGAVEQTILADKESGPVEVRRGCLRGGGQPRLEYKRTQVDMGREGGGGGWEIGERSGKFTKAGGKEMV